MVRGCFSPGWRLADSAYPGLTLLIPFRDVLLEPKNLTPQQVEKVQTYEAEASLRTPKVSGQPAEHKTADKNSIPRCSAQA